MPLEGRVYHRTQLLPDEHALFRRQSDKTQLKHEVKTALRKIKMPASSVSFRKPRGTDAHFMKVYLKDVPARIEQLPKAEEAIRKVLRDGGINHLLGTWTTISRPKQLSRK